MLGQVPVPVQQLFNDGVLFTGLYDPVDGHVLFQVGGHHLGVGGQGIELRRRDIQLGEAGGQHPHQHVHRDQDGQYHEAQHKAVSAHLGGAGAQRLPVSGQGAVQLVFITVLHPLYLFFSQDCTHRNRKNAAALR